MKNRFNWTVGTAFMILVACGLGNSADLDRELAERSRIDGLVIADARDEWLGSFDGSVGRLKKQHSYTLWGHRFLSDGSGMVGVDSPRVLSRYDPLGRLLSIMPWPDNAGLFAVTSDLRRIAYSDQDMMSHGQPECFAHYNETIYWFDHGSQPQPIVSIRCSDGRHGSGRGWMDWSPSGDRLVFEWASKVMLFTVATKSLTEIAAGREPNWSPDGRWISYMGLDETLQLYSLATGKASEIKPGLKTTGGARWSPDSRYILVTAVVPLLGYRLMVIRVSDGAATRNVPLQLQGHTTGSESFGWLYLPKTK